MTEREDDTEPDDGTEPAAPTGRLRPGSEIPAWLDRAAGWSWRILLIAALAGLAGWLFLRMRIVVLPVFVALLGTAVLYPPVAWLKRRGIPAAIAALLVSLLAVLATAGAVSVVSVALVDELGDNEQWNEVLDDVRDWLQTGPLDLDETQVDDLENRVRDGLSDGLIGNGVDRVRLVAELATGVFLAGILTFFFLKDGDRIWTWLVSRIAPNRAPHVDRAGQAAFTSLSRYMTAVAITGVIDAVAISLGLVLIGVPLVVPLAIITFFGAFFPIVGATTAGAIATIVALVANGPVDAVLVAGVALAVQQLEGDVLMPILMRRAVELHPVAVLVALGAGGALAGLLGAFVAVPLAAMGLAAMSTWPRPEALQTGGAQPRELHFDEIDETGTGTAGDDD
ncbi:MAG: AI-2E family transporter [Acidimicrobiales bacterium]